jgi:hypothetical protein
MITTLILNIVFLSLTALIGLLPTVIDTGTFTTAITTASGYMSGVYAFIPVITATLLAILSFDILFESGYLLYKVVYWVIRRFPTQS